MTMEETGMKSNARSSHSKNDDKHVVSQQDHFAREYPAKSKNAKKAVNAGKDSNSNSNHQTTSTSQTKEESAVQSTPTAPGHHQPISYAGAANRATEATSSSHENNNINRSLAPTSVLAPTFVPTELQELNFRPVASYIKAKELPNMFAITKRTYHTLMRDCPQCFCKRKHPSGCPLVPEVPIDPYFALRQETLVRKTDKFSKEFKKLENVSGRDEYIKILHELLREEYEEKMVLYERYTQYQTKFETKPSVHQAVLTIPGIHNARPPIESGDKVLLRPHSPRYLKNQPIPEVHAEVIRTIRGSIQKPDKVVITWLHNQDHQFCKQLLGETFSIRFLPSTKNVQRCFAAIQWVRSLNSSVARQLLFPSETPKVSYHLHQIDDHDRNLNDKQRRFVNMVLARTRSPSREKVRPPMILTGPAGTGKTKTLLASILKTLDDSATSHNKRILVCTPSHTAADVITRRLSLHLSPQQLFRLYSSERPVEMISTEMLPYAQLSEEGTFILPPVGKLLGYQIIVCTCSDAHILVMAGLTNSRLRMRRQCVKNFAQNILNGAGLSAKIEGADETHFTHLFIDEAAQATEPESLVPLSVVVDDFEDSIKVEIALAGDPRQLSPDIFSPWAADGLQKSLLERLLRLPEMGGRSHLMGPPSNDSWTSIDELIEYSFQKKEDQDNLSVFLTTSYRGHPSFLIMPSKLFYFGKLHSMHPFVEEPDSKWHSALRGLETGRKVSAANSTKQLSWPIHFRGVHGDDKSVAVEQCWGSNSWSNPREADAVVEIVRNLVSQGISTQSIGVMAAFRAQVVLIRQNLRKINLNAVNVGIVEDYQAVERDVIILSLTRATPDFVQLDSRRRVGLFKQEKRMNVALTRAENMLVVVGCPKIMLKDPLWFEWLKFCFNNGLWYGDGEADQRFEVVK